MAFLQVGSPFCWILVIMIHSASVMLLFEGRELVALPHVMRK